MAADTDKRERLTPAEARAAVQEHGGIRPAARAHGVPGATFQYWLDPEYWKDRMRRSYAADPEKKLARNREHYHSRSALQHARHALQKRRSKALKRMGERNRTEGVT